MTISESYFSFLFVLIFDQYEIVFIFSIMYITLAGVLCLFQKFVLIMLLITIFISKICCFVVTCNTVILTSCILSYRAFFRRVRSVPQQVIFSAFDPLGQVLSATRLQVVGKDAARTATRGGCLEQ